MAYKEDSEVWEIFVDLMPEHKEPDWGHIVVWWNYE